MFHIGSSLFMAWFFHHTHAHAQPKRRAFREQRADHGLFRHRQWTKQSKTTRFTLQLPSLFELRWQRPGSCFLFSIRPGIICIDSVLRSIRTVGSRLRYPRFPSWAIKSRFNDLLVYVLSAFAGNVPVGTRWLAPWLLLDSTGQIRVRLRTKTVPIV